MGLQLAAIFGDNMVLQREVPVPLWGTAPPGAEVEAELDGAVSRTQAGPEGSWRLDLPAAGAGGPYTLTVRCGEEKIRFQQVYRGEVWLAGGQSNMELALKDSANGKDAVQSGTVPRLHLYMTPKATTPEAGNRAAWQLSSPASAGEFSAVAWYAGKTLTEYLPDIHIGVISCCWGGTYAHCWMPREELDAFPEGRQRVRDYDVRTGEKTDKEFAREEAAYQQEVDAWNTRIAARRACEPDVTWEVLNRDCGLYPWPPPAGRTSFQRPGNLYDAMLSPLAPYALRGFWYYQGEQDEEWPEDYCALLTRLIGVWRRDWGDRDGKKPFLLLQLPMYGEGQNWPILRKAQADAAKNLPNVHLAVLADCGEADNIHPVDKKTPGTRLGLLALESVYRLPVAGQPPVCVSAQREEDAVLLRFDHVGGGLYLAGGASGFQLAGPEGTFVSANAQVTAPDTVRVTAPGISQPVSVRYAWYSFGPAGLRGGTGLAAGPLSITL